MGDRGNIVVDGVWLYTHWRGSEIEDILRRAMIKGKSRLDDGPYLARIVFCEMIEGSDDIIGFGISTTMCDNEHDILFVDTEKGEITIKTEKGKILDKMTFGEFVNRGP